jgi:hypothetical protein
LAFRWSPLSKRLVTACSSLGLNGDHFRHWRHCLFVLLDFLNVLLQLGDAPMPAECVQFGDIATGLVERVERDFTQAMCAEIRFFNLMVTT